MPKAFLPLLNELNPLDNAVVDPTRIFGTGGCPLLAAIRETGGAGASQGLWNLTTLAATFMHNGKDIAHEMACGHSTYSFQDTNALWDRKMAERRDRGLKWPSCSAFRNEGSTVCDGCPHWGKIKGPLNLSYQRQTPPAEPSFVNPYAEFAGPQFPLDILPPVLAGFVEAEHRAMGADPSAIAMAAITAVAGAMHAETVVKAGEGWWERPILWTALIGNPSTMKSPIITKTAEPLNRIDHEKAQRWEQEYAKWQQNKTN
jgi:hypothetical protein